MEKLHREMIQQHHKEKKEILSTKLHYLANTRKILALAYLPWSRIGNQNSNSADFAAKCCLACID